MKRVSYLLCFWGQFSRLRCNYLGLLREAFCCHRTATEVEAGGQGDWHKEEAESDPMATAWKRVGDEEVSQLIRNKLPTRLTIFHANSPSQTWALISFIKERFTDFCLYNKYMLEKGVLFCVVKLYLRCILHSNQLNTQHGYMLQCFNTLKVITVSKSWLIVSKFKNVVYKRLL